MKDMEKGKILALWRARGPLERKSASVENHFVMAYYAPEANKLDET